MSKGYQRDNYEWIQDSETGSTYICPEGTVDKESASSEELDAHCVDESSNPQNN